MSFITEDVGNRPPMLTEGRKRTQHAEFLSGVQPFLWTPKRKSGVESNYCTMLYIRPLTKGKGTICGRPGHGYGGCRANYRTTRRHDYYIF